LKAIESDTSPVMQICVSCRLYSSMKPTSPGALAFDIVPAQAYMLA